MSMATVMKEQQQQQVEAAQDDNLCKARLWDTVQCDADSWMATHFRSLQC